MMHAVCARSCGLAFSSGGRPPSRIATLNNARSRSNKRIMTKTRDGKGEKGEDERGKSEKEAGTRGHDRARRDREFDRSTPRQIYIAGAGSAACTLSLSLSLSLSHSLSFSLCFSVSFGVKRRDVLRSDSRQSLLSRTWNYPRRRHVAEDTYGGLLTSFHLEAGNHKWFNYFGYPCIARASSNARCRHRMGII
jgi:hypothetical protein